MAEPYRDMREAVVTMYEMSQEEVIRNQCLARILYQGDMNGARAEGRMEGREEGIELGVSKGQEIGMRRINDLNVHLIAVGRLEDLMRASEDMEYQDALLEEFGL